MGRGLVALLLAAAGCGGTGLSKCAGPYAGTWTGTSDTDKLELTIGCEFRYSNARLGCASAGTYAAPLGDQGSVQVVIESQTGPGCVSVGTYACYYTASASTLTISFGAGAASYRR